MGLSWQQGPLSPGAIGRFLVPEPMPKRLLYAELLRRRMRVRFGGTWIADSEHVLLLFEPGRYASEFQARVAFAWPAMDAFYDHAARCASPMSYREAYPGVASISDVVSFEPDIVSVQLDDTQLHLEPGQTVFPHGPDRDLDVHEATGKQA